MSKNRSIQKDILTLLQKKFPQEAYVIMQEVSDDSGFARSRSLDYMVVSLWPSRGLAVTGIEKKSSRFDWLKELKNPKKQENHFKYCDYFYLLTDQEDVAKLEEIPETWGWYHSDGNYIKVMKEAPRLEPLPISKTFMIAMLMRAADKNGWIHRNTIRDKIDEAVEKAEINKDKAHQYQMDRFKALQGSVNEFEAATGLHLSRFKYGRDSQKIGEAVKFIMDGGVGGLKEELTELLQKANYISANISSVLNLTDKQLID